MAAARVRGWQRVRSNSDWDVDKLKGFVGVVVCWYAKQSFLGLNIYCSCWRLVCQAELSGPKYLL